MSDTASSLACCVCGSREASPWRVSTDVLLGGGEVFHAVRCRRCGTVRLDPRPSESEMARFYAPETYARSENEAGDEVGKRLDAYNARVAARADALVPSSSGGERRALDVGCGDGRFLQALAARGWSVEGTETDPVAARYARTRTGATIHEGALEVLALPEASCDLLTLLHVLEHVPDPRATLAAVRRLLRPGGALLLALPNAGSAEASLFGASWYHLDLPRHLWGFHPRSLVRLVEECGFDIRGVSYLPFLFAPQSVLRIVRSLRGSGTAPRSGGSGGGAWQTRLFTGLLDLAERAGTSWPGEIMELSAVRTEGETG